MSMPHSEGWYDDPDGSDAERYFDGQQWTPRRRRKEPAPKRSSPAAHPYGDASMYPSVGTGSFAPPTPASPYDAYPPPVPPNALGQPPSGPPSGSGGPWGSNPAYGYPQGTAPSHFGSTMAAGITRTLALVIGALGLALVATAFMPWGQVREVGHDGDTVLAVTFSFPGLGEPAESATMANGTVVGTMNVSDPSLQLHGTNPGWVALLLGVAAAAAAAALLWAPQRSIAATSIAVLGGAAGLLCAINLFDLRGTFGNPPNLADTDFSPGAGLIAACALAFLLTGFGVWAYVNETKGRRPAY